MPKADAPAVERDAGSNGADKGTGRPGEAAGGRPIGDGASTSWAYCIDPGLPRDDSERDAAAGGWIGAGSPASHAAWRRPGGTPRPTRPA
jgi:hypothetical protein